MRAVVIGLVFAAIILAGGTAYLLRDYISSQQAEFAALVPTTPTTKVLVAKANAPIGTLVEPSNTEWIDWPESGIQDTFLLKSKDANIQDSLKKNKYMVRRSFAKGEPITMARLYKSKDPGFLRGALSPGMRALAVRSGAENSAAGFILPGDRVDVMLTHNMLSLALQHAGAAAAAKFKGGLTHTSETIIENLRVLAIDQKVSEFQEGAQVGKTVLLEVSPKDAERLQTAKAMGRITLVLRAARRNTNTPKRSMFTTDVEVSPLLRNFDRVLKNGKLNMTRSPSKRLAQKKTTRTTKSRSRSAPRTAPKQLTIYRGTSGSAKATGGTAP
ncbi:MAG: Flp pilus assembly protein CpaB [Magnetovibrio sp.]|nr:Flp pilus assembly protein CpaB [Magnetovibrio sp.]